MLEQQFIPKSCLFSTKKQKVTDINKGSAISL